MVGFLSEPTRSTEAEARFDQDLADYGFVMNVSRLWAYQPDSMVDLFDLIGAVRDGGGLEKRQLGILVAATASTRGDSYCSLAWGWKLSDIVDADTAADVIRGGDAGLSDAEATMARWARRVVDDPNGTTQADVDDLRDAGFDDDQIFAITTLVALRLAFSTVNDALGARPDAELLEVAPAAVIDAVDFGRPVDT